MSQDHRVECFRCHGKFIPVFQSKRFEALEKSAVDEQAMAAVFKQVSRAGYGSSGSQEGQFHIALSGSASPGKKAMAQMKRGAKASVAAIPSNKARVSAT